MASLRSIRSRIKSVRNMQKITKALKLVSAAKLRRAQEAVVRTRPYAQLLDEMLGSLAGAGSGDETAPHPLMAVREPKRIEVLLLTSDRGLAGGFNANIIRRAQRFIVEEGPRFEDIQFLIPVHPNPNVSEIVKTALAGYTRITLCEPLDYAQFVAALKRCHLVLTDSGGVQEEAPALGKPVLVMRTNSSFCSPSSTRNMGLFCFVPKR